MSKEHAWNNVTYGDRVLMTFNSHLNGVLEGTVFTIETVQDNQGYLRRKSVGLSVDDDSYLYVDYRDIQDFYIIQPVKEDLATWVDPYEDYAAVKVEASDPMIKHHIIAEKWSDHMWHIVGETKTFSWEGLLTYYSNVSATQAKITPLYVPPRGV